MRLGNWIFTLEQTAKGPSPVLYNVYTNGLAGQWFKPGAHACGRRAYKIASDIHTAVTVVQEQLEKVSHSCLETEHRTTSFVPSVSECDTQCHRLWSGSHNPVTV